MVLNLEKIKVLFIGVFNAHSTNLSQGESLRAVGCNVIEYDYRNRAQNLGSSGLRDQELIKVFDKEVPDLTIFAKCNNISDDVVKIISKKSITCMWYCDPFPMGGWPNIASKIKICHFSCLDKAKAVNAAKAITNHAYHVCEGYDSKRDVPFNLEKNFDVSFIGNLKKDGRREKLNQLKKQLTNICSISIFQSAYGDEHAKIVSQSNININLCTRNCASDRVYKILAAGGFLLTDNWVGRSDMFKDNQMAIFKNADDLKKKIKYFINNKIARDEIAKNGYEAVKPYTREKWAMDIIKIYKEF